MLFLKTATGLLALVPFAMGKGSATKDLTSVLESHKNLTTFYDLVKVEYHHEYIVKKRVMG